MSADPARRVICSIISNAEFAATNSTPAGIATFRFAPTKVTLAPLLKAESARATPCFPLALLPINRIGSIASLVPPAEMEQRRLAAIQAQQRYNAGYDNSFAGVYEETFEETAEVTTEDVEAQADAAVVADNQEGDDAAPTEETVS